jgi:hypothetical protein
MRNIAGWVNRVAGWPTREKKSVAEKTNVSVEKSLDVETLEALALLLPGRSQFG